MKKDSNTVEKHFAVTTMLAQHTATLNCPGTGNTAVDSNPGYFKINKKQNFLNNLNFKL